MNIYTKNAVADDMILDDTPEDPELPQRRYQQLHLGEGRKP